MLLKAGYTVNRKRVCTLMQVVGIKAVYCKPNTSKPTAGHRIDPYLLRGLAIVQVHQVWATDITAAPDRLRTYADGLYLSVGYHRRVQSIRAEVVGIQHNDCRLV
jgi:transposase InsO family protein